MNLVVMCKPMLNKIVGILKNRRYMYAVCKFLLGDILLRCILSTVATDGLMQYP